MPYHKQTFLKSALSLSIGLSAGSAVVDSMAQSATLEEIVVTATRRAESLQDVPISMIATSGESIDDLAITRGDELTANLPAITIAQNPVGNFVFIRGIGTAGANQGIEQSVSIFHDNIYMGRHQLSRAPFMDLARVEVLRGPQSILFGKNTIGGAIHVVSATPTREVEGSLSALYGWEDGEQQIVATLSGPISETLSGRVAYRGYGLDGHVDNIMNGEEGPERDDETVRLQLSWDASETINVLVKWEASEFETVGNSTQLAVIDPTGTGVPFNQLNSALVAVGSGSTAMERWDDERAVINDGGALLGAVLPEYAGLPGFPDQNDASDNSMDLGSLTITWEVAGHTLTSITGYAAYEYQEFCDCDFAALPLIQVDAQEDYDQFSQEVRLTSPGGEKLDYILGFYYHESDLEYQASDSFGSSLASPLLGTPAIITPNLSRDYRFDQKQDMWSLFAQGTYSFTDATRLTVGARYFEESKDVDHVLEKRFAGGWDYSAFLGLPAGSLAYGDTASEYDRFLAETAGTPLGAITEGIYAGLLGTFEHQIIGRERDEDDWMWSVTLEQDLSADTMVFATLATGTKGGGFDARFLRMDDNPFFEYEEETATNYELGIKTYLLDGSMSLNATAFLTVVEDYQVSIFDGATAFFVQNAAEVESKGIEFDMRWAAMEELTIGFAGSYLDNEFNEFPNAPCWTLSGSEPENRGDCVNVGTPAAFRDAKGDTNQFSPEWAFNLNLEYAKPVSEALEFRSILNLNYSDEFLIAGDLDPIYAKQPSYTTVDLRLALGTSSGSWELAFLGKNLTDELISGSSNDQPLVPGNGFAYTNRLRSYAVQGIYRF